MYRRSRLLAIDALLATLIVIFSLIPIAIGPVSLAFLMLLPVFVAGQIERFSTALFAGTFLGIMSLISAFVIPLPTSPIFYNPLVSILPRMLVGIMSWCMFRGLCKVLNKTKIKNKLKFYIASTASTCASVLTNTGLVLAAIWIFFNGKEIGGQIINGAFLTGLISLNFITEIVICTLITPPIVMAIKSAIKQPLLFGEILPSPLIEDINNSANDIDENHDNGIDIHNKSDNIDDINIENDNDNKQ